MKRWRNGEPPNKKKKRNAGVVALYAAGHSMREVAGRFGVSLERVRQIVRREQPSLIRPMHDTRSHSSGLNASARRRWGRTSARR